MITMALRELFGGKAAEAVLMALLHHGKAYGRNPPATFRLPRSHPAPAGSLRELRCTCLEIQGRKPAYARNPKSRLAYRLRDLTGVVRD